MSWWNIFERTAVSDSGEVINKLSDITSVSSNGTYRCRHRLSGSCGLVWGYGEASENPRSRGRSISTYRQ